MKRTMKKIITLVLTMCMVLAMSVTVFADTTTTSDNFTITINENTKAATSYEAYQVFGGDLNEGTLSNVTWGSNIDSANVEALQNALNVSSAGDAAEKLADGTIGAADFADIVSAYLTGTPITNSGNAISVPKTAAGYYLIKNKDNSATSGQAYTKFVLEVVKDCEFTPKTDAPSVEKKIGAESDNYTGDPNTDTAASWVDANTASIGDTVNYKLSGTIPSMTNFDGYTYIFHDTLSDGLTFTDNSVVVKLQAANGDEIVVDSSKYYVDAVDQSITVSFKDIKAYQDYAKINVYYQAVLNEYCVVGTSGNPNEVYLEYNNNPNDKGNGTFKPDTHQPKGVTGETPKDTVITYTTEIEVDKIDGADGKALVGAEFQITGTRVKKVIVTKNTFAEATNGTYYKLADGTYTTEAPTTDTSATYANDGKMYELNVSTEIQEVTENVNVKSFVGTDGKVKFTGLADGTYTLKETTTPAGYNTVADKTVVIKSTVPATVSAKTDTASWTYNDGTSNVITIENNKGAVLPTTGGMGTTLFYVVGMILVLGAGVVLVARRRMAK